jgi:hypothetical protein
MAWVISATVIVSIAALVIGIGASAGQFGLAGGSGQAQLANVPAGNTTAREAVEVVRQDDDEDEHEDGGDEEHEREDD